MSEGVSSSINSNLILILEKSRTGHYGWKNLINKFFKDVEPNTANLLQKLNKAEGFFLKIVVVPFAIHVNF